MLQLAPRPCQHGTLQFNKQSPKSKRFLRVRMSTLRPNGTWPDVDYTTGCDAQAASWPAQEHWSRISLYSFVLYNKFVSLNMSVDTFSAAWHGGLKNALQFANSSALRANISLAMNFWFENDFTDPSCLDFGGESACPCGTPGLWDTNWYSNVQISAFPLLHVLADGQCDGVVYVDHSYSWLCRQVVPSVE